MGVAASYQRGVGMSDYTYPPGINMPPDNVLLFYAVCNAMPVRKVRNGVPRWVAVMDTLQLGSTYSREICARFGLDPDEKVRR